MALVDVLGIVKVKCEEATGLQLAGNDSQGISVLQQVATIISSEFGATDEVAAVSPAGDEPSEEEQAAELYAKIALAQKCLAEVEVAVGTGNLEAARDSLLKAGVLIVETFATESG